MGSVDLQFSYIINYWTGLNMVCHIYALFMILLYSNVCLKLAVNEVKDT